MRRILVLIASLLAAALVLSACGAAGGGGAGGQEMTVTMTDFKFEPSQITVQQGQPVTVSLPNNGSVTHNFAVPDLGVESPDVAAGETGSVTFTPDRSGTFKLVCTEPGHEQAGMVGQVQVSQQAAGQ